MKNSDFSKFLPKVLGLSQINVCPDFPVCQSSIKLCRTLTSMFPLTYRHFIIFTSLILTQNHQPDKKLTQSWLQNTDKVHQIYKHFFFITLRYVGHLLPIQCQTCYRQLCFSDTLVIYAYTTIKKLCTCFYEVFIIFFTFMVSIKEKDLKYIYKFDLWKMRIGKTNLASTQNRMLLSSSFS